MQNPKRALAAFNSALTTPVGGYDVREITLGLAGILEAIESPLFTGSKPETVEGWAPTLYAMTRSPAESRRILASGVAAYNAQALAWADADVPVQVGRSLIEAVTAALNRLNGISPDDATPDGEAGAEGNVTAAGPTAG